MTKKKILEGYKRQGKRFIPPMKQISSLRESSYVNDLLPELIWLGLIHDRSGYQFGARTLEAIIEVTQKWPVTKKPMNYALQSAYTNLSNEQKEELISIWKRQHLFEDIQYALAPLVLLYEGFPLAFVGPPPSVIQQNTLIERIKRCVGRHLDKHETPAIVLHGTMLLTRLVAGTLKIAAHIDIPDLNSVIERPDSDEAKRAASFMRASAMAEFCMLDVENNNWARYFWNRGAELTPCERPTYAETDD